MAYTGYTTPASNPGGSGPQSFATPVSGYGDPQNKAYGAPSALAGQALAQQYGGGINPYQILFPGIQAQQGYNSALVGLQNDQLQQQLGFLGLNQSSQSNYLNQNYQNQLARYGLQGQQLGLQGQSYAQQGQEATSNNQFTQEALARQLAQARAQYGENRSDLIGGSAAAGSTQTMGTQEQNRRLGEGLMYTTAGINQQQAQANKNLQFALQNVQREQQGLGLSRQGLTIDQRAAQQQLAQQLQQLGISTGSQQAGLYGQIQQNNLSLMNPQNLTSYYQTLFGNS